MSNHAIRIVAAGDAQIMEAPVPKLRDDYILVKTAAIALNPTDWKHVDYLATPGTTVGCDYSGTVLEVGSAVTTDLKKGDRVYGFGHGSNSTQHEDGVFAEIVTTKGDLQTKIPENMSFEEAATLGVGISTVGQAMYQALELPFPSAAEKSNETILIYGGSSATGALGIQFAKLSGLKVVATCSPHNFEYVKSLGADEVFDYKSPTCAQDIKDYTKDSLTLVFDCISESASIKTSVEAMSSKGGKYVNLLSVKEEVVKAINPNVTSQATLAYTIVGEPFSFGPMQIPTMPGHYEFGLKWWPEAAKLLADGKVKVHKPTVDKFGKGLEGALKGLQHMKEGKVSGEKLVYTM